MKNKKGKNISNVMKVMFGMLIMIVAILGKIVILENDTVELNSKPNTVTDSFVNMENLQGKLEIHFIDVGQADSILITQGEHHMLIDAGNNDDEKMLVEYLRKQNIDEFEYIVGTHPHEDHIGGMDYVLQEFNTKVLFFPKVSYTTKTFQDVISAASAKNLKFTTPVVGTSYELGDAFFEILAPNSSSYKETNDYSIVIRMTYGNNHFLLMGDAEIVSENEILKKGNNITADLLKVGHHGSNTSTGESFLKAVTPKYAVISVGKGNPYDHPVRSVMERLKNSNIMVYRTDESGTIIATSDGNKITFNVDPGSYMYSGDK